jgi:hypothetical protein
MPTLRGKFVGAVASAAGLLLMATSALLLATPGTASAATYDFKWPDTTGCQDTGITVATAALATGKVELRYSTKCRTVWSRVTVYPNALIKDPNAWVVRNSDGASTAGIVKIISDSAGDIIAFSEMLNDAGVTSYARGSWTSGDGPHSARTASY